MLDTADNIKVINSLWIEKLRTRLCGESKEPDSISEYYDASMMDGRLEVMKNVALSPHGVPASQDGRCSNLLYCESCYLALNNYYGGLILILLKIPIYFNKYIYFFHIHVKYLDYTTFHLIRAQCFHCKIYLPYKSSTVSP